MQQVGGFSTQPTMDTQPTFYMQAFLGEVAWYSGTQGVKPKHRLKKDPALSSHVVLRSNTFFFYFLILGRRALWVLTQPPPPFR